MISILIKCLNEERNIERCLRSALDAAACAGMPAEVIVCDSLSTDRTVEIAKRHGVRIVQLIDPSDRSCGIGAQMGFQVARGDYLYILDGDMELEEGFLPAALRELQNNPQLGGVAGLVREMHAETDEFRNRVMLATTSTAAKNLATLDMGGLYRRTAIESIGYLTNRNLHSFEEFELGVRLLTAGWQLQRLDVPAVRHYGHTVDSYALLRRRWRTRYAFGHGELLREAKGSPHFRLALRQLRVYRIQFGLLAAWLLLLMALALWPAAWVTVVAVGIAGYAGMVALMAVRKGSLRLAIYSLVSWHVGLAGLLAGWLAPRRADPRASISLREVQ